jgi:hypothetical protein
MACHTFNFSIVKLYYLMNELCICNKGGICWITERGGESVIEHINHF